MAPFEKPQPTLELSRLSTKPKIKGSTFTGWRSSNFLSSMKTLRHSAFRLPFRQQEISFPRLMPFCLESQNTTPQFLLLSKMPMIGFRVKTKISIVPSLRKLQPWCLARVCNVGEIHKSTLGSVSKTGR